MSASPLNLVQMAHPVLALTPNADAAGRTGAYVSLKHARRAYVIVSVTQANAATVQLNILQPTAAAATASKAITNAVLIWADLDTATSDALVEQTAAVNYTTDAALKNKVVIFEVDASSLDVANGFDCIAVQTGASNVANITAAVYVLVGERYQQTTPLSAVVD